MRLIFLYTSKDSYSHQFDGKGNVFGHQKADFLYISKSMIAAADKNFALFDFIR